MPGKEGKSGAGELMKVGKAQSRKVKTRKPRETVEIFIFFKS